MDQFASHVVRALLALLSPHLFPPDSNAIRSKRSSAWKSNQGAMKSVFASRGDSQDGKSALRAYPIPEFSKLAGRFVQQMRKDLGANEVRALAANKVASPVLQVGRRDVIQHNAYFPLDVDRNRGRPRDERRTWIPHGSRIDGPDIFTSSALHLRAA